MSNIEFVTVQENSNEKGDITMVDWIDNLKLKICGSEIKHCKEVLEKINLIRNGQYAVLTVNDLRIIQEELEERLARNEANYIEAGGKTADLKSEED